MHYLIFLYPTTTLFSKDTNDENQFQNGLNIFRFDTYSSKRLVNDLNMVGSMYEIPENDKSLLKQNN